MRVALLADVHANLLAYEAVEKALKKHAPDLTLILGDLVGYGADPAAVLEMVRAGKSLVVAGNHDIDVLKPIPISGTHRAARTSQLWTRSQLDADALSYLASLPYICQLPCGLMGVHGCYLNDSYYNGYITGSMVECNLQTISDNEKWPPVASCGHTHIAMFAYLHGDRIVEPPVVGDHEWPAGCPAVLVNPGSVGQPRDGNTAARFALLDMEARKVAFRSVPYDVEAAAKRILSAGLPVENGARLLVGR